MMAERRGVLGWLQEREEKRERKERKKEEESFSDL